MERNEKIVIAAAVAATVLAGVLHQLQANVVLTFVITAGALASLAMIVGDATEQLGSRLGPGATGILQSALGNLPELFVCIFALRAGLVNVVKAALVGSILGNSLLVFGFALFLGGLKNGTQTFRSTRGTASCTASMSSSSERFLLIADGCTSGHTIMTMLLCF